MKELKNTIVSYSNRISTFRGLYIDTEDKTLATTKNELKTEMIDKHVEENVRFVVDDLNRSHIQIIFILEKKKNRGRK